MKRKQPQWTPPNPTSAVWDGRRYVIDVPRSDKRWFVVDPYRFSMTTGEILKGQRLPDGPD